MFWYYINLERAPERREYMETLLAGRPHERIPAVDGRTWDGTGWRKQSTSREAYWRNVAGCWFSHIKALERAIEADIFPCCILEDDVEFVREPTLPDTGDMVYFGGIDVPIKNGVYGLHAVAYRTSAAAAHFLKWLRTHRTSSDGAAVIYQKRTGRITYSRPWSIIQRDGYSYIQDIFIRRSVATLREPLGSQSQCQPTSPASDHSTTTDISCGSPPCR